MFSNISQLTVNGKLFFRYRDILQNIRKNNTSDTEKFLYDDVVGFKAENLDNLFKFKSKNYFFVKLSFYVQFSLRFILCKFFLTSYQNPRFNFKKK